MGLFNSKQSQTLHNFPPLNTGNIKKEFAGLILKGQPKGQSGQILLIVVLAAVVSLTVGLSAVSRSITNTNVTTEEANSQKALSAAEAGVEQLIKQRNPATLANELSDDSGFSAEATPIQGYQFKLNGGNQVLKDDGADIWLTTYPNFGGTPWTGTLRIFWDNNGGGCGTTGTNINPAIEVVYISGNRNTPDMTRTVFDACPSRGNGFINPPNLSAAERTADGKVYSQAFDLNVAQGYIIRVIPLYANAVMGARVLAGPGFPSQGHIIDSVGTSGNTKRSVRVFKGYPKIPIEYFPYNLFQTQ